MPFNGAGMFVRLRNWVEDATAGVKIRADYHDSEDDNFAGGISQCIARDGQSTVTNNIPMNSKRIIALADPVDPQDGSTKAYADTKLPLAGGTLAGPLTVNSTVGATGYITRTGSAGAFTGNAFNFNYTSGLEAWINTTNLGVLATQAYVEQRAEAWAAQYAAPKVNRAGDTMTGGLTVNGQLIAVNNNLIQFSTSSNPGFLQWNGGGSYALGLGGNIWHTGNLNPILDARLYNAGGGAGTINGPGGSVVTALTAVGSGTLQGAVNGAYFRYLQLLTPGGWYTVGYAG